MLIKKYGKDCLTCEFLIIPDETATGLALVEWRCKLFDLNARRECHSRQQLANLCDINDCKKCKFHKVLPCKKCSDNLNNNEMIIIFPNKEKI